MSSHCSCFTPKTPTQTHGMPFPARLWKNSFASCFDSLDSNTTYSQCCQQSRRIAKVRRAWSRYLRQIGKLYITLLAALQAAAHQPKMTKRAFEECRNCNKTRSCRLLGVRYSPKSFTDTYEQKPVLSARSLLLYGPSSFSRRKQLLGSPYICSFASISSKRDVFPL
jgi:hypothetical protein